MEIKLLDTEIKYTETEEKIVLEVNGKSVTVFKYTKQDTLFGDYEYDIEIKDKDNFTEEEQEEIIEYIENMKN